MRRGAWRLGGHGGRQGGESECARLLNKGTHAAAAAAAAAAEAAEQKEQEQQARDPTHDSWSADCSQR